MLLAFDTLPSVLVGAHMLGELSSPTFGKREEEDTTTMDDLREHEGYIRQLVEDEDLDYPSIADRLRSIKSPLSAMRWSAII